MQRIGSFMMPKEGIDRQILQTALEMLKQSIIVPSDSDSEED